MSQSAPLDIFVNGLKKVPDPRSKQGVSHPFLTAVALVFLGLLANRSTIAQIERWAKIPAPNSDNFCDFEKPAFPTASRCFAWIQIEENQGNTLKHMKLVFEYAPQQQPNDRTVAKKVR